MRTPPFAKEAERWSYGITSDMWSLRPEHFKLISFPVPPVDEQAAIVKYLGHAHARIDRAIAAKRKLIALLEEQKQVIINESVTRGLDPHVPLKDPGVPWLGPIPAHWEIRRAKRLFREFDRRSGTGQEPLLSLRLAQGLIPFADVSSTEITSESLRHYKMVQSGDFVMNRMRAATGLFAVAGQTGLVSPDYATMHVDGHADASYYLALFKTAPAMAEFRRRCTGLGTGEAGFMRLYFDQFGRIPLPVPSIAEQRAIAEFISLHAIPQSFRTVAREIDLLQEFRTRLTSDVVTGQVDVRAIAATLPELTDEQLAEVDEDSDLVEEAEEFLEVSLVEPEAAAS